MPPPAECPHADRVAAHLADPDAPLPPDLAAHLTGCPACLARAAGVIRLWPAERCPSPSLPEWLSSTAPSPGLSAYQAEAVARGRAGDLELGPYLLLDRIGAGGMGEVYRAWHRLLRREDAVKRVRPEFAGSPPQVKRFLREVEAAARLRHPNVVAVYTADRAGNDYYLAMEYVPGVNLGQLVRRSGPVPVGRACDYVRQAALGLQHALDFGLVHRDVKPANLLLTADGATVKVTDFGLARALATDAPPDGELTATGMVLGTPDYMAPEQAEDPRAADTRSDLYGLGCTLFYLLTGGVPFPGGAAWEKMGRHATAPPPALPGVPSAVAAVVHRLMAKRPADRFQTPAELAAALAAVPAALPSPTVVDQRSGPPPAPDEIPTRALPAAPAPLELEDDAPPPRRPLRPRWVAVGAVVGVLALIGTGVALLGGKPATNSGGTWRPDGGSNPGPGPAPEPARKGTLHAPPDLLPGAAGPWKPAAAFRTARRPDTVQVVGFGADGEVFAGWEGGQDETGEGTGWWEVWSAVGGDPIRSARPVGTRLWENVRGVAPRGLYVLTGQFRKWNGVTFAELSGLSKNLNKHGGGEAGNLDAVTFTPDGKFVVGSVTVHERKGKRYVVEWEGATDNIRTAWEVTTAEEVRTVAVDRTGHRVAGGTEEGRVFVVTTSEFKRAWEVPKGPGGKPNSVLAVAIDPDGKKVYAGYKSEGPVRVWDVEKDAPAPGLDVGHRPDQLAVSADGRWLAAAGLGLTVWELKEGGARRHELVALGPAEFKSVAFSQDSNRLAVGGRVSPGGKDCTGGVWVWDLTGP